MFLLAMVVAGTAAMASLFVGDLWIDAATVWDALVHHDSASSAQVIVRDWRFPRAVADLLVGAALGMAGAIMQATTRNPLASPSIMGLSTGASFFGLLTTIAIPTAGRLELMLASIAGAAFGAALVYGVASAARGGMTPVRLALTGVAVSSILAAIGNGVTIYFNIGQDMLLWYARGSEGVQWPDVIFAASLIIAGLAGGAVLSSSINALGLGDHVATGLGLRTSTARFLSACVVLLLAGAAVALAGPVGFIGLLAPHVARGLVGLDYRAVIPNAAAIGAAVMVLADVGARLATTPYKAPVPVGVVTALLGVPFFLYLANSRSSRAQGGRV
ncbi:FecCD family ABC transporter permease [Lacipirellula sp.]|uniref:FecCD family ABC transporter permease n=1 Tax=Lacipirellula sp. TaxID=2691419 RepID=UPI003D098DB7